jgi:hypothetical protein
MPTEISDAASSHSMYCVKCRTMVSITGAKKVVMKSSRHAIQGNCPFCNTATYKIVAKTAE